MTYEEALTARRFYHKTAKKASGDPQECRRNGKTKTWKTRPGVFSIPVKQGLYSYGYITNDNAAEWEVR